MINLRRPAELTENCRSCGTQSLLFLGEMKSKATLQKADPATIRIIIQKILHLGQVRENMYLMGSMYSKAFRNYLTEPEEPFGSPSEI